MMKFPCPNCRTDTISFKDKYLAGIWKPIECPACQARLSAFPVLLLLYDMLYVWNVLFWVGMYYFEHNAVYLGAMLLCWLILDFFNVQLIPLAVMKKRTP